MKKEELHWDKRSFLYAGDWLSEETLAEFLGLTKRQVRRARTNYVIRQYMADAYERKTVEELEQFMRDIRPESDTHTKKLDHEIQQLEQQYQKLNERDLELKEREILLQTEKDKRPSMNTRTSSRSSIMILSVCVSVILTIVTLFLLPHEAISRINEFNHTPFTPEQLADIPLVDYLLMLMPMIYFGLTLTAAYCIDRKFA